MPCLFMKVYAMKECEAPELKRTVAEFELSGNVPITSLVHIELSLRSHD